MKPAIHKEPKQRGFGGGWFKNPRAVVHRILPRYGPGCACVLMILCEARDQHSLVAIDTSQEEIARLLGRKVRQVYNLTKPLRDEGLVECIRRGPKVMWYQLTPEFKSLVEKMEEQDRAEYVEKRVGGKMFNPPPVELAKPSEREAKTQKLKSGNSESYEFDWQSIAGQAEADQKTGNRLPLSVSETGNFPTKRPAIDCQSFAPIKNLRNETSTRQEKKSSSSSVSGVSGVPGEGKAHQPIPTSSSSQHIDRSKVRQAMAYWVPSEHEDHPGTIDQDALETLIEGCLARDPMASTEDLVFVIREKGGTLYTQQPTDMGSRRIPKPSIDSPVRYLCAAVWKCFEGGENSGAAHIRRIRQQINAKAMGG